MMLFKSKKEKEQPENVIAMGLSPCLSGDDIIQNAGKELISQIKQLISAPNTVYAELYIPTLYRYAEFCQSMPRDKESAPYGLLTGQLRLVIAALQLRRGLLLPANACAEAMAEQEPQWTYAIFSAALLYQINRIQEDRQITLHTPQGDRIGSWHPLVGSLNEPGRYFSIQWQPSSLVSTDTLLSAMATRFISSHVIRWLSKNPSLLTLWWNAMTSATTDENNPILEIIQKASEFIGDKNKVMKKEIKEQIKEKTNENSINSQSNESVIHQERISADDQLQILIFEQKNFDPVSALLDYLHGKKSPENPKNPDITWLRVQQGLFICMDTLHEFLVAGNEAQNYINFMDAIQPYLVNENDQTHFRYRPQAFEDRRILEGMIIKEEHLTSTWKELPINSEFQPAITL